MPRFVRAKTCFFGIISVCMLTYMQYAYYMLTYFISSACLNNCNYNEKSMFDSKIRSKNKMILVRTVFGGLKNPIPRFKY